MVFSFRLKQFFSSQEFLSLVYMTHSGGGELVLPFLCQSKLHPWNLFSRLLILLNLHVCRELRSRIIQMQTIYGNMDEFHISEHNSYRNAFPY